MICMDLSYVAMDTFFFAMDTSTRRTNTNW